ncbi:hypothetical protein D3C86_2190090 [compost metagenome]
MPKTIAAMTEVIAALRSNPGKMGAPGSVPAVTSPVSAWLRTPKGSTAKSTVHQITK